MGKLSAIFGLMWQGRQVADPAAWKRGAITVNTLVPVLAAIAETLRAFGVPLAVTTDQLTAIAGGALALFNVVVLAASDSRVGLQHEPKADVAPADRADAPVPVGDADGASGPAPPNRIVDPGPG